MKINCLCDVTKEKCDYFASNSSYYVISVISLGNSVNLIGQIQLPRLLLFISAQQTIMSPYISTLLSLHHKRNILPFENHWTVYDFRGTLHVSGYLLFKGQDNVFEEIDFA